MTGDEGDIGLSCLIRGKSKREAERNWLISGNSKSRDP
jgi:hypothetical protein